MVYSLRPCPLTAGFYFLGASASAYLSCCWFCSREARRLTHRQSRRYFQATNRGPAASLGHSAESGLPLVAPPGAALNSLLLGPPLVPRLRCFHLFSNASLVVGSPLSLWAQLKTKSTMMLKFTWKHVVDINKFKVCACMSFREIIKLVLMKFKSIFCISIIFAKT